MQYAISSLNEEIKAVGQMWTRSKAEDADATQASMSTLREEVSSCVEENKQAKAQQDHQLSQKQWECDEQVVIANRISEDIQARTKNSEDQLRHQVDELRAELYSARSREKVKDEEIQTLPHEAAQAEMGQYRNAVHEEGQQQHLSEVALQAWEAAPPGKIPDCTKTHGVQ